MSKRLGQTPFREILPDSIAKDQTIAKIADIFDSPLDSASKTVPELLIFSRLAKDSGLLEPVPLRSRWERSDLTEAASPLRGLLPPLERLAKLAGGLAQLPEDVLDLLAWQLHVERYETATSLAAKRAMVFASVILHRKRGTPWAVRYGLETTLQVPARVEEWFQYGGEPYFFRVYLDVSGVPIDARALQNAISVIFAHKNTRSWLDYLCTRSTRKLPIKIGAAGVQVSRTQAFTWRWPLELETLRMHRASACVSVSRTQTLPKFVGSPVELRFSPVLSVYSLTKSLILPKKAASPLTNSQSGSSSTLTRS